MIRVGLDARWRVNLAATCELPMSIASAWNALRDFRRFACMDVFHRAVHLERPDPASGVGLRIEHGLLGLRVMRVGRILAWAEGRSYSFSDLSLRGPRAGFPHVYRFELQPAAEDACRLTISVRGLWTARLLPRPAVRAWLGWNLLKTRASIQNALLLCGLRST
jgi:hypothetical protein